MKLYWYRYRPDVTDSSGERAAAEKDNADYGECPTDYEEEVAELTAIYLGLNGIEEDLARKTILRQGTRKPGVQIYVDPIPLYRARFNDEVFGWKGHLALYFWNPRMSKEECRVFSFYIRKGCETLFLHAHGPLVNSLTPMLDMIGFTDLVNRFTELSEALLELGTLTLNSKYNDNLVSSEIAGSCIAGRAKIMQKVKKRKQREQ